jgi:hypothetical protein
MPDENKNLSDRVKAAGVRIKEAWESITQGPGRADEKLFQMLDCIDAAIDTRNQMIKEVWKAVEVAGLASLAEGMKDDLDLVTARVKEAQTRAAIQAAALKGNPGDDEIREALLRAFVALKKAQNDQIAVMKALRALQSRNV